MRGYFDSLSPSPSASFFFKHKHQVDKKRKCCTNLQTFQCGVLSLILNFNESKMVAHTFCNFTDRRGCCSLQYHSQNTACCKALLANVSELCVGVAPIFLKILVTALLDVFQPVFTFIDKIIQDKTYKQHSNVALFKKWVPGPICGPQGELPKTKLRGLDYSLAHTCCGSVVRYEHFALRYNDQNLTIEKGALI